MIRVKILILLAAVALLSACANQRHDANLASRSAGSPLGFQAAAGEQFVLSGQLEDLSQQEWQANQPQPAPLQEDRIAKKRWHLPALGWRANQNVSARSNISLL